MTLEGLTFVKQQGEHGLTSPQVVYLGGKRFLFVGGMFASNFINIFRYDGEIAIPSGLIMQWGGLPVPDRPQVAAGPADEGPFDLAGLGRRRRLLKRSNTRRIARGSTRARSGSTRSGNIWMAYGFFRYDFQGLDDKGNPTYRADKVTR